VTDPGNGDNEKKMLLTSRNPYARKLDIRDHLATLVAGGNNLSQEDKKAVFQGLANELGQEQAQKVLLHTYMFNNRPDVQRLPIEEKLRTFYDIGSNDKGVHDLLMKTKALGYGILPGFRGSSSAINQKLSGLIGGSDLSAIGTTVPQKVVLSVGK